MVAPARNLLEAATGRGRVLRQGDIVCLIMDGAGAVVVNMADWIAVQKWAQSRPPSGNLLSDRARFLEQFQVLIARPGTVQATRGNDRQLERLAQSMLAAGYDLGEWVLPAEFKDLGKVPRPGDSAGRRQDATPQGDNADDTPGRTSE